MSNSSGRDNSLATTTFCWLPPDRAPAGVQIDSVRMSNWRTLLAGRLFHDFQIHAIPCE